MDKTRELETLDIKRLLWMYAVPAVVSQVISSIYNIADRIFIGQGVSALAIAGIGITMPIMNIIHAFGSLVGAGSSARMSIVLGKKDERWAEKILGNSMLLTFLFGALFVSFGYGFMDEILSLFGATDDTIAFARRYLQIVLPGMFLTTLTFNLTGLIRASGYPRKSMWILAGGAALNMILDPLFIFGFGWGIAGAAWATTISMAVSAIFAVSHFVSRKSFIRFKAHCWEPKLYIFRNIVLIGLSPFLMNIAASAVVAIENSQLIRFGGDMAVATFSVVNTFGSLIVMVMLGVCFGMQPIAGYNYGAGHPDRLKAVYMLAMKVNVALGLIAAAFCLSVPGFICRLFSSDPVLIGMSRPAMRFIMALMPLIGFTITNSQFFQSIDKPWIAIVTSLSRQVLFLVPMLYLVPSIVFHLGGAPLTGVWLSCTISDFLGACLALALLLGQRKVFGTYASDSRKC